MVDIFLAVVAIFVIVIGVIGGMALWARRYVRVPTNMAMIVFGRVHENGAGYKIVRGGGQFIVPVFEDYAYLSLNIRTLEIAVNDIMTDVTGKKIKMNLKGTAQVKIGSDEVSLETAAEILLHKTDEEISNMARTTVEGHIRSVFPTLTIEAVDATRDELAHTIQALVDKDLKNMGMTTLSFVIKDVVASKNDPERIQGPVNESTSQLLKEISDRLQKIETRLDKLEKKLG
jgi:flotillin